MSWSPDPIRSHFPVFRHRPDLAYLDNAATTQKPETVIRAMNDFYEKGYASAHRGLYELAVSATNRYEETRKKVASLIGAHDSNSIAFTKGTTESINLVAQGFVKSRLKEGDNIVISAMEHHANLIPWQQLCNHTRAILKIIPVDLKGDLVLKDLPNLLDKRTRILCLTHTSNVLGTINPLAEVVSEAHAKNIPVLVDGAQSVGHILVDVHKLDIDFLAFSGHKMFGPMGTGILYCKEVWSKQLTPLNFGGGSVRSVEFGETEFSEYPTIVESGTGNVAGVIGLGAAIDFIQQFNMNDMAEHAWNLNSYFREQASSLGYVQFLGAPKDMTGIVSFQIEGIHPHDVASFLANEQIAVRAGHHCAQPLLESLNVPATVRASFTIYNTRQDVDRTIVALKDLKRFWS